MVWLSCINGFRAKKILTRMMTVKMYSKKEASNKMDAGITVQNEIEDIHHPSSTIYHIASSIKSKVENASKELHS